MTVLEAIIVIVAVQALVGGFSLIMVFAPRLPF